VGPVHGCRWTRPALKTIKVNRGSLRICSTRSQIVGELERSGTVASLIQPKRAITGDCGCAPIPRGTA
jgi:hypothetical protein